MGFIKNIRIGFDYTQFTILDKLSDDGFCYLLKDKTLVKANKDLSVVWIKNIPEDPSIIYQGLVRCDNGDILLNFKKEGDDTNKVKIIRLNSNGELVWKKQYIYYSRVTKHCFTINNEGVVLQSKTIQNISFRKVITGDGKIFVIGVSFSPGRIGDGITAKSKIFDITVLNQNIEYVNSATYSIEIGPNRVSVNRIEPEIIGASYYEGNLYLCADFGYVKRQNSQRRQVEEFLFRVPISNNGTFQQTIIGKNELRIPSVDLNSLESKLNEELFFHKNKIYRFRTSGRTNRFIDVFDNNFQNISSKVLNRKGVDDFCFFNDSILISSNSRDQRYLSTDLNLDSESCSIFRSTNRINGVDITYFNEGSFDVVISDVNVIEEVDIFQFALADFGNDYKVTSYCPVERLNEECHVLHLNPSKILANGTSQSVITLKLRDTNGVDIVGEQNVVMSTSKGSISSTSYNPNGTYQATVTSSNIIEEAEISFTVNGIPSSVKSSIVFGDIVENTFEEDFVKVLYNNESVFPIFNE